MLITFVLGYKNIFALADSTRHSADLFEILLFRCLLSATKQHSANQSDSCSSTVCIHQGVNPEKSLARLVCVSPKVTTVKYPSLTSDRLLALSCRL